MIKSILKDNPVRVLVWTLALVIVIATALGQVELANAAGALLILLPGGEAARAAVTPKGKAEEQASRAYHAGLRRQP